MADINAVL